MIKSPFFTIAAILLVMLIAFSACKRAVKFDKEKWKSTDGLIYPMRDRVLDDLLATHKLKGMTYKDVIRLLGRPNDTATLKTSYEIINTGHEYNPKLKPIYKKYLEFYFNKDSIVTRTAVYEHTDKEKKKK